MNEVRWGIIGCGEVTEVKSGPALQYAEGSRLVAVMRRNVAAAEDYARRHGVPRWYSKVEELLSDDEIDAVYVATPPGNHLESALKACEAGKPVYVEKPAARSFSETLEMTERFRKAGLKLFVAYYRRALPRFLKVKELLDSKKIGTITGVSYRYTQPHHREIDSAALPWRLLAEQSGGGLLLDLGSHTLDILDFLFGPLLEARGRAANLASEYAVEDVAAMEFIVGNGTPGTASWNFAGGAIEDRIEITGTDGRIALSTFGDEPVAVSTRRGEESFPFKNPYHIQQPLIQLVVNDLLGKGESPSTGESAARTAQAMDAVLADYYGGRSDDFWAHEERWKRRGQSNQV